MTLVVEVDIKGSLPISMVAQGNKDQGMQIVRLRQVIADYVKEHKLKF